MWLPYVYVDDVDGTNSEAVADGSRLTGDIMEIPNIGRFGTILDPEGATIALITPAG